MKALHNSLLLLPAALLLAGCKDSGEFAPGSSPAASRTLVCAGQVGTFAGERHHDTRITPLFPALFIAPSEDCPILPAYYASRELMNESWYEKKLSVRENFRKHGATLLPGSVAKAAAGHHGAMLNTAALHHEGAGTSKNDARAMELLQQAAQSGSNAAPVARYSLRFLQMQGGDFKLADALKEIEADASLPDAFPLEYGEQLHLIGSTKAGSDAERQQVHATLTTIAAKDKTGSALYAAALNHRHGLMGVSVNPQEALALYQQAADAALKNGGYAPAQLALGHIYHFGLLGAGQDRQKALEYYTRAAGLVPEQGATPTMHRARTALAVERLLRGECHQQLSLPHAGQSEGKDDITPADALRAAAEQGDHTAAYNYAVLNLLRAGGELTPAVLEQLERGAQGGQADIQTAVRVYRALLERDKGSSLAEEDLNWLRQQNTPAAKTLLGNCYATGMGVERNMEEAVRLYRESEASDPAARHNLALCYAKGAGCEQNKELAQRMRQQAAETLRAAAPAGNPELLIGAALSELCRLAVVAPPPPPADLKFLAPACYLSPNRNIDITACYYTNYSICDIGRENWYDKNKVYYENEDYLDRINRDDPARAKRILAAYEAKARQGDGRAMLNVGVMYNSGIGTPADSKKAMECFRKAAKMNASDALYNIRFLQISGEEYALMDCLRDLEREVNSGDGNHEYGEQVYLLGEKKAHTQADRDAVLATLNRITAKDNTGSAHYISALNHHYGQMGVGKNAATALRLYQFASEQKRMHGGYARAKLALAYTYHFGWLGQAANHRKAFDYYILAAATDDNSGETDINQRARGALAVYCILRGEKNKQLTIPYAAKRSRVDRIRPVPALKAAAEYGDAPACYNYGMYRLIQSKGVLNDELAEQISHGMGSEQEDIMAFASIYASLHSGKNNSTTADVEQLRRHGSPEAQVLLATCYATGTGTERNPEEAARLFAAHQDRVPAARHNLGLCYEYGIGVPLDKQKAEELKAQAERELKAAAGK